ncbi:MAG: hypothetical protein FWH11_12430 [Micrococcales bacterium]|nr:hypothetical protein [Micrococcales bacterium]
MHGISRGRLFRAIDAWCRATAVLEPSITRCGIWDCCGCNRPTAETRDILDDLLRQAPSRPARELRRLIRQADTRIAGDHDGPWWRSPLWWR